MTKTNITKKQATLLLFFIPFFLYSQTNRFFYELKSRKDTTEKYKTNIMVLDVNPKSVKFYDKNLLDYDSINKNSTTGSISRTNTKTDQLIIRKKNTNENNWYRDFFDYFVISTNDPIKWELSSETKNYNQYKLQKATTSFGGRTWEAWFSKEIEIPEGPYKFRGLPGLIFLLEDSEKNFVYSLVKNKKLTSTYDTTVFLENHYDKKPIKISNNGYNKYVNDIYENPTRLLSESIKKGNSVSFKDQEVKSIEELNQQKKMMQNSIKNRFIYIEKDKEPVFKE